MTSNEINEIQTAEDELKTYLTIAKKPCKARFLPALVSKKTGLGEATVRHALWGLLDHMEFELTPDRRVRYPAAQRRAARTASRG